MSASHSNLRCDRQHIRACTFRSCFPPNRIERRACRTATVGGVNPFRWISWIGFRKPESGIGDPACAAMVADVTEGFREIVSFFSVGWPVRTPGLFSMKLIKAHTFLPTASADHNHFGSRG